MGAFLENFMLQEAKSEPRIGVPVEKLAIGLDFGTSNTSVATSMNKKVDILQNDRHENQTPSIVALDRDRILIGDETTASAIKPENIVFGMKRLLGRTYKELEQKNYNVQPFRIEDHENTPIILVDGKELHVEQIVAILFSKLLEAVSAGQVFGAAVLTVPSSFGVSQREALMDAAKIAGIPVRALINETTAAAIAFSYRKLVEESQNVLIFQLGGGTIDIAIFCIKGHNVKLLSSISSCDIGGEDFTQRIMDFVSKHSSRLRLACEKAKTDLAKGNKAKIKMVEEEMIYSEHSFEAENKRFLEIFVWMMKFVVDAANLKRDQIDKYFVAGRSTVIPTVANILKRYIGEGKRKDNVNAGDVAVAGAAIYAELLIKEENVTSVTDDLQAEKIIISNGKVFPNCKQISARSALQKQLDALEKIARLDQKLELEFTVRAQLATGFCKEKLKEMKKDVIKLRETDESYLVDDGEKIKFTEKINKLEDDIKELMSKTNGDNKNLIKFYQECKELDKWICDGESISKNALDANQKKVEEITEKVKTLKLELQFGALDEAKEDFGITLATIKSRNEQNLQMIKKCEEFALELENNKEITVQKIIKMKTTIRELEKEKAMDDLKSTLDKIKERNVDDSQVIERCKEIAMWLQQNEEAEISEIKKKKEDLEKFEERMKEKAMDDLKSTLDKIKERNVDDSQVIERCKEIAMWLQQNEEAEISKIKKKREDLEKFENKKAMDDLKSTLDKIKERNVNDSQVIERCKEIAMWLQQNEEAEISEIKKKKEDLEKFVKRMKEKAMDDLKSTLDKIKERNVDDSQVIERCKEIAMWLQQNEKVSMLEIHEKKKEVEEFEEIVSAKDSLQEADISEIEKKNESVLKFEEEMIEKKLKVLQEAKDDLKATVDKIKVSNNPVSQVIEKCKEILKWLEKNEEVDIQSIHQTKESLVKFEKRITKKKSKDIEEAIRDESIGCNKEESEVTEESEKNSECPLINEETEEHKDLDEGKNDIESTTSGKKDHDKHDL